MKALIACAFQAALSNLSEAALIASLADGTVLGSAVTFLNLIRQRPGHAAPGCRACL